MKKLFLMLMMIVVSICYATSSTPDVSGYKYAKKVTVYRDTTAIYSNDSVVAIRSGNEMIGLTIMGHEDEEMFFGRGLSYKTSKSNVIYNTDDYE